MSTSLRSRLRAGFPTFGASIPMIFAVFVAVIFALALSGCASWCRKDSVHAKIPARNGMNAPDCACTQEFRRNLCLTVNGRDSIPAGLSFQRQHEDGWRDTVDAVSIAVNASAPQCFGEARGVQRIFFRKNGVIVDSTGWFEIPTVDCCHAAAKTVDFKR